MYIKIDFTFLSLQLFFKLLVRKDYILCHCCSSQRAYYRKPQCPVSVWWLDKCINTSACQVFSKYSWNIVHNDIIEAESLLLCCLHPLVTKKVKIYPSVTFKVFHHVSFLTYVLHSKHESVTNITLRKGSVKCSSPP